MSADTTLALVTRVMAKSAVAVRHDPSLIKQAEEGDWIDTVTGAAKDAWKNPYVQGGVYGAGAGGLAGLASSAFAPAHRKNYARDILTGMIGGGAAGVGGVAAYKGYNRFFGDDAKARKAREDDAARKAQATQAPDLPAITRAGTKAVVDVASNPQIAAGLAAGTAGGVASNYGTFDPSKTFDRGLLNKGISVLADKGKSPVTDLARAMQRFSKERLDLVLRAAQTPTYDPTWAAQGVNSSMHRVARQMVPQILEAGGQSITGAAEAGGAGQALGKRLFQSGYKAVKPGLLRSLRYGALPGLAAFLATGALSGGSSADKAQQAIDAARRIENP